MAEVSIRAVLAGFDEAAASFNKLNEAMKASGKASEAVGESSKKAAAASSQLESTFGSLLSRYVSITAVVAGFTSTLTSAVRAGIEARETNLRLDAVLAATGHVAGLTATQLRGMAEALQAATRFDDTGIKNAMSVMLTFKGVQGDTFNTALKLAADLSEMYRMDLSASARIVGRALQDPVQGLGMLSRFIGRLAPEQERMIQLFMEQGRVMDAQKVIVDVMTQKFGGLATKIGTDSVSALDRFGRAWKNLLQDIGQPEGAIFSTTKLDILTGWLEKLTKAFSTSAKQRQEDDRLAALEIINSTWATVAEKEKARIRLHMIDGLRAAEAKKTEQEVSDAQRAAEEEKLRRQTELNEQLAKGESKLALDRINLEIETGKKTLEDRIRFIDARLAVMRKGTQEERAEELALRKLRLTTIEEIFKREDEARQRSEAQTEEELADMAKLQAAVAKRAEDEIAKLNEVNIVAGNLVRLEGDEKIKALEALALKYAEMGDAGVEAYLRIQAAIQQTRTTSEIDLDRMARAWARVGMDITGIILDIERSMSSALSQMLQGNLSFSDAMKRIWKSMLASFFDELARMATRALFRELFGSMLGGGGGGGGGFSFFGTASTAAASSAAGSAGGGGGGGLFAGLFGGGAGAAGGAAAAGGSAPLATTAVPVGTALAAEGGAAAGGTAAGGGGGAGAGAGAGTTAAGIAAFAAIAYLGISSSKAHRKQRHAVDAIRREVLAAGGDEVDVFIAVQRMLSGSIFTRERAIQYMAESEAQAEAAAAPEHIGLLRRTGRIAKETDQAGAEHVVTSPKLLMVGEVGPERVTVSPLAGAAHRGSGGGIVNNFYGPTVFDEYTMRQFTRRLATMLR